jgi:hypothetical protein
MVWYYHRCMIYIRFHDTNFHEERCGFEIYHTTEPDVCGEPAIGYRGKMVDARTYLCNEHFQYLRRLEGEKVQTEAAK